MNPLYDKMRVTLSKYRMVKRGEGVVVAVSGGPDSVFLLHAFLSLQKDLGVQLHIAHMNHRLRGEEAEEDACFVQRLAERKEISSTIEAIPVDSNANLEEEGRRIRYRFLEKVRKETSCQKIATGHTLNDQAETLLLRLLRGSGRLGLASIPPVNGRVIRPLLEISHQEILNDLQKEGIPYRMDSSNSDRRFLRNRIRSQILVLEREFNPELVKTLARTADIFREEEGYLEGRALEVFERLLLRDSGGTNIEIRNPGSEIALNLKGFSETPLALRRRVAREAIRRVRGDLRRITYRHLNEILRFSQEGKSGDEIHLPSLRVQKGYDALLFRIWNAEGEMRNSALRTPNSEIPLVLPGITRFKEYTLESRLLGRKEIDIPHSAFRIPHSGDVYFDYTHLHLPLYIRNRREGDRFQPFGMEREKRLKKVLIDDRFPREERNRLPLLCDQKGILWVVHHRRSDRAKIREKTRKVLAIKAMKTTM